MKLIKIKESKGGKFHFVYMPPNNNEVATSKTYTRKSDCKRAAMRMIARIVSEYMSPENLGVEEMITDETA